MKAFVENACQIVQPKESDLISKVLGNPLVSIIIPCYNAKRCVSAAINSALNQSWKRVEVIVVDDGSTDGSLEIIAAYGNRIRWTTQTNGGGCAARNRGLRLAKGDYIQFLDADDMLSHRKVETQLIALGNSKYVDVSVCGTTDLDSGGIFKKSDRMSYLNGVYSGIELLTEIWTNTYRFPLTNCWLCSRKKLDEIGPWNEDLIVDQDGEYFGRVLASSKCIVCVNSFDAIYRLPISGNISLRKDAHALRARIRSMENVIASMGTFAREKKVRRAIRNRWLYLAVYVLSPSSLRIAVQAAEIGAMYEDDRAGVTFGGNILRLIYAIGGMKVAVFMRWLFLKFFHYANCNRWMRRY